MKTKKYCIFLIIILLFSVLGLMISCNYNDEPEVIVTPSLPPQLPEITTVNANIHEVPEAVFLNGCVLKNVQYKGETVSLDEYRIVLGFFIFKYNTWEVLGTGYHIFKLVFENGEREYIINIYGYQGTYNAGINDTIVIGDDMNAIIGQYTYLCTIKGTLITLNNNQEQKQGLYVNGNIIFENKIYSKDLITIECISGISNEIKDVFIDLRNDGYEIRYFIGNTEITNTLKYFFEIGAEYSLTVEIDLDEGTTSFDLSINTVLINELNLASDNLLWAWKANNADTNTVTSATYVGKEAIRLYNGAFSQDDNGAFLIDQKLINAARAAGYLTMTVDIYLPSTETAGQRLNIEGYMAGGNIHNINSDFNWKTAQAGPGTCIISNNNMAQWKKLYIDLGRFFDDETIMVLYTGREIYLADFYFHYLPITEEQINNMDISLYAQYLFLPNYMGSLRDNNISYEFDYNGTGKEGIVFNANNQSDQDRYFTLNMGFVLKLKELGYSNFTFDWDYIYGGGFCEYSKYTSKYAKGNYQINLDAIAGTLNTINSYYITRDLYIFSVWVWHNTSVQNGSVLLKNLVFHKS